MIKVAEGIKVAATDRAPEMTTVKGSPVQKVRSRKLEPTVMKDRSAGRRASLALRGLLRKIFDANPVDEKLPHLYDA